MLKLKHLQISSFGENVVYLNKNCQAYKISDISKTTRLEIQSGNKTVYALLQVVDDEKVVGLDELALNSEAFKMFGVKEGSKVNANLASPLKSINSVKRKISGEILTSAEYASIVEDITEGRYSKADISAFLVSCSSFMSSTELVSLTEALISKKVIHWDDKSIVVNQHCLGGVPGNKTDLIVLSIVSAYGLPIVKPCVHSLTSSSGVADTMETIAEIDFNENKLQKLVNSNNGAIICYDSLYISKANKMMHDVRNVLGIDQNEFIIASILSMMISSGVNKLVLDIPVGENARIKSANEALRIRKQIEYVGDMLGLEIDVVVTDGSEPIGCGVGAVLEIRDVMKVLKNYDDAPKDLREKALFLAGRTLEFDPKLRGGQGYAVAKEILESGRALDAFEKIVNAQGRKEVAEIGEFSRDVVAPYDGVIEAINNKIINKISSYSGAIQYQGSGLDLHKKVGDKVKSGESLYTVYSCNSGDFDIANLLIEQDNAYTIIPE